MEVAIKPGMRFREVGEVINRHATMSGFSLVKSVCGHGIGELFHCAPNIPHYARVWRDRMWPDGWTVVTADGKRSAQFEHTLLVTETGVEVLTARLPSSPKVFPWVKCLMSGCLVLLKVAKRHKGAIHETGCVPTCSMFKQL
ncbi:unnamed protein product [Prunus armeniaca]|uniref:Peptidase M24 domain-containing protein n=1 Tax=Prunus armeniaca TaxID=36596 RepID=A0A6J5U251_PRUAR|nr:unnamed protein product [Prunus armeniaca]